MGKKTGAYDVVFSDDMNMFDAKKLAEFDAMLFNNTTKLEFNRAGAEAGADGFCKGRQGDYRYYTRRRIIFITGLRRRK